jgi:hypothetical protein
VEQLEFACICFADYWFNQDSALPNTEFSNGKLELIIFRRSYIQGRWAIVLRQFGRLYRGAEEEFETKKLKEKLSYIASTPGLYFPMWAC